MNAWTTAAGEQRSGLNVSAWKVEKVAAIGKNRQFREKGHEVAASNFERKNARTAERQNFELIDDNIDDLRPSGRA